MTPIAPLIEAFFNKTLARQRGVSRHTRDSYALSFQLLFVFAAKKLKVSPSALTLEQLDAGLSNYPPLVFDCRVRFACGVVRPGCL
jgi:integrase/recombinase XerD